MIHTTRNAELVGSVQLQYRYRCLELRRLAGMCLAQYGCLPVGNGVRVDKNGTRYTFRNHTRSPYFSTDPTEFAAFLVPFRTRSPVLNLLQQLAQTEKGVVFNGFSISTSSPGRGSRDTRPTSHASPFHAPSHAPPCSRLPCTLSPYCIITEH